MRVWGKRLFATVFLLSIYLMLSVQADNTFYQSSSASEYGPIVENDTIGAFPLTLCSPLEVGMNPVKLSRIDSIVTAGIRAQVFPGCQVLVMKEGKTVYDKCFGNYTYGDTLKVQPTTMYDLASLSKTTGTLMAVMKLYDNSQLKLTDKVSLYLDFLKGTDKENITLQQLLVHESGLPAYLPFYQMIVEKSGKSPKAPEGNSSLTVGRKKKIPHSTLQYKEGMVSDTLTDIFRYQVSDSVFVSARLHEAAMQSIAQARLGARIYNYSCVNFMLLKEVVETISRKPMDEYLDQEFYRPMHLNHTTYLPLRKFKKEQLAPTLKMDVIRRQSLQGYVHDMDAALLGGVSGNAGLFASAGDVATIYQMLLNGGELNGRRYLSPETCRVFTTTTSTSGRRGLGFDKPVPGTIKGNPCCLSAPKSVYGHTGYTGTCSWVDPDNQLVYVFLSNRTFPYDGVNKLAKTGIRTKIQDAIYQSLGK